MSSFTSHAIMLRRIDHGDYDLIITFFTLEKGKISVIAKSAKKSVKRFSGSLEPFSVISMVCAPARGRLPVLQETALENPFENIRADIKKTAYASYWAELINQWLEEGKQQADLYHLFYHALDALNASLLPAEAISILFQIRFLKLAGLTPNLSHCCVCECETDTIECRSIMFDLAKGGLICEKCGSKTSGGLCVSKGTVKQLQWTGSGNLNKAMRVRLTPLAIKEGLDLLEAFVPYHLGKEPRSLKFLRKIRG